MHAIRRLLESFVGRDVTLILGEGCVRISIGAHPTGTALTEVGEDHVVAVAGETRFTIAIAHIQFVAEG